MTFLALSVPFMQNLEGFEVSLLELMCLISLKLDERVNAVPDLPYHQVQIVDMLQSSPVLFASVLRPNVLKELEVMRLVRLQSFLGICLVLWYGIYCFELGIEIVLLLSEAVQLPHQQTFAERLADGLELTYFIELVRKFRLGFEDLHVFPLVMVDELSDLPL